jgi:hypothetical protein
MPHTLNLDAVGDDELLRRLSELTRDSRRVEADLVAHIGEVDARKLYAREACSSTFDYCRQVLHLSEFEAYLRITVARASREHPMLLAMLRDGLLHLSGIARLAPHLTPENREALLKRAVHRSKREIEELVAEVAPRPDASTVVRKLPAPGTPGAAAGGLVTAPMPSPGPRVELLGEVPRSTQLGPDRVESPVLKLSGLGRERPDGEDERDGSQVGRDLQGQPTPSGASPDAGGGPGQTGPESAPFEREGGRGVPARPAAVEPLSPARYKVSFTASAELRDKLERLQALMRSSVPDGDLAKIIDRAVSEKLERLEAKRFAKTKAPRKGLAGTDTTPKSRYVPAPVRRAVHTRDGDRCTYRDALGRRCRRRGDLEFHHWRPFGRGGPHNPGVVALMCRAHNLLLAERDYGKEKMARYRRAASRVPERLAVPGVEIVRGNSRPEPRAG